MEQWKKGYRVVLFRDFFGDEIPRSYVGIIINHYKDQSLLNNQYNGKYKGLFSGSIDTQNPQLRSFSPVTENHALKRTRKNFGSLKKKVLRSF